MADKSRKKTFSVRAALGQRNAKNRDITNNPQATSQTSLNSSTSAVNSKPSLEWTKYFLDESLLSLSPKERNIITEYIAPDTQDVRTAFDQTYDAALRQKQFCDDQALVLRFRGHSLTVKDKAAKIVSWLDRFKFVGGMAVNIDPIHFGLPWAAFSIILEVLVANQHQLDAILNGMDLTLELANRLEVYLEHFAGLPDATSSTTSTASQTGTVVSLSSGTATANFRRAIVNLYAHLLKFVAAAIQTYKQNPVAMALQNLWRTSELIEFGSESDTLAQRAEFEASNCDRDLLAHHRQKMDQWKDGLSKALDQIGDIRNMQSSIDQLQVQFDLSNLTVSPAAAFDSLEEGELGFCLQGTRLELCSRVERWANDAKEKSIFWLRGNAGTGKSTISRTMARSFDEANILGASFFLKRGERHREDASRFFPTITRQLAHKMPSFAQHLSQALRADPSVCTKNFHDQFNSLLFQPLNKIAANSKLTISLILIIDALDECEDSNQIEIVLGLLPKLDTIQNVRLRTFATSRPELPIQLGFQRIDGSLLHDMILESIQATIIDHDLELFFRHKLEKIGTETKQLEAMSHCRIHGPDPEGRLHKVLNQQNYKSMSGLYKTYAPILDQVVSDRKGEELAQAVKRFKELVGVIVSLAEPLSAQSLGNLFELPLRTISDRLRYLHSVLQVPKDPTMPIRLFHLSFRDLLVDETCEDTSVEDHFCIDEGAMHQHIMEQCLQYLMQSQGMKQDMLASRQPGLLRSDVSQKRLDEAFAPEMRYACCYWVWHLTRCGVHIDDDGLVHRFLKVHFLHWLECLSWFGQSGELPGIISDLRSRAQFILKKSSTYELILFLDDAKRFVLKNHYIIGVAPLQTYYSALAFAPRNSIIRSTFASQLQEWLNIVPQVPDRWSAGIQNLEGEFWDLNSLAFSTDGKHIASATLTYDGIETVQIWNVATGKSMWTFRNIETGFRYQLTFSPDNKLLAAISNADTVTLWDLKTGRIKYMLKKHNGTPTAFAFCPEGKNVAIGTRTGESRIWDLCTEKTKLQIEMPDSESPEEVSSLLYGPDGGSLVSVRIDSKTYKVRLVTSDTKTGRSTCVDFSKTHGIVKDGAFDEIGRCGIIMFSSGIALWKPFDGNRLDFLEVDASGRKPSCVALSANGTRIAMAFPPAQTSLVGIWNTEDGFIKMSVTSERLPPAHALALDFNGRTLASYHNSESGVRLWNTNEMQSGSEVDDDTTFFGRSIDLSPNCRQVATMEWRRNLVMTQIWNLDDNKQHLVNRHLSSGLSLNPYGRVVFSPDGSTLLTTLHTREGPAGSSQSDLALWDSMTCEELRIWEGNPNDMSRSDFTWDGWEGDNRHDTARYEMGKSPLWEHESSVQIRGDWVFYRNQKILWLPIEYRPGMSSSRDKAVAIYTSTATVILLEFR